MSHNRRQKWTQYFGQAAQELFLQHQNEILGQALNRDFTHRKFKIQDLTPLAIVKKGLNRLAKVALEVIGE